MAEDRGEKRVLGSQLIGRLTYYPGEILPEVLRFNNSLPRISADGIVYARWNKPSTIGGGPITVETWYLKVEGDHRIWHSANGNVFNPFNTSLPDGHVELLRNAGVRLPW